LKSQETRTEFIRLRAEGKSYSDIAAALEISKDTCSKWERELKEQISQLKSEQLNELYNSYYMTREARIKKLGDTLNNINTALDGADFKEIPPEKLLDFKLKYTEALKEEYIPASSPRQLPVNFDANDLLVILGDILNRVRSGEATIEQASKESLIISNLLKAYDTVELKAKLDTLEAIVGGRK
jgi:transcriptional regulator with XRE-family HTH domain